MNRFYVSAAGYIVDRNSCGSGVWFPKPLNPVEQMPSTSPPLTQSQKDSWSAYCAASVAIKSLTEISMAHIAKGDREASKSVEQQIERLGKLDGYRLKQDQPTKKPAGKPTAKSKRAAALVNAAKNYPA